MKKLVLILFLSFFSLSYSNIDQSIQRTLMAKKELENRNDSLAILNSLLAIYTLYSDKEEVFFHQPFSNEYDCNPKNYKDYNDEELINGEIKWKDAKPIIETNINIIKETLFLDKELKKEINKNLIEKECEEFPEIASQINSTEKMFKLIETKNSLLLNDLILKLFFDRRALDVGNPSGTIDHDIPEEQIRNQVQSSEYESYNGKFKSRIYSYFVITSSMSQWASTESYYQDKEINLRDIWKKSAIESGELFKVFPEYEFYMTSNEYGYLLLDDKIKLFNIILNSETSCDYKSLYKFMKPEYLKIFKE